MDSRKMVKEFINCMCNWVERGYKQNEEATGFRQPINEYKLAYLLADKGIEKRIQKQLFKRLNLKSIVRYELNLHDKNYPNGNLIIELTK